MTKITEERLSRLEEKNIIIDYNAIVQEKIISDPTLFKFLKQCELGLKKFIKKFNIKLICNFTVERDFEIRTWERIFLEIFFENDDFPFERRIYLWDQIDDIIRQEIQQLISKNEDLDRGYISNLNKRFFIELSRSF